MKRLLEYIKLMYKYSPKEAVFIAAIRLFQGIAPVMAIVFTTEFVNLALDAFNKGIINKKIYLDIAILLILYGYDLMLPVLHQFVFERSTLNLKKSYRILLLEKCAKIEYQYIENSNSWDSLFLVLEKPEATILENFNAFCQLAAILTSVSGIMLVIVVQIWWIPIVIVSCCAPVFYFSVKSGKANYKAKCDTAQLNRKADYYSEVLSSREYVDERSIFSYTSKINQEYREAYLKSIRMQSSTKFRWFIRTKLGGVFTALASLVIILVLLNPAVNGVISIGMFISLVNAVLSLTWKLSWELSSVIDTMVSGIEYVKELQRFMCLNESIGALEHPKIQNKIETIEFKNVSFTYPDTDIQILNNVSFLLEYGKHYAFVGANGAGKSSVIKLLTGLYRDYSGEILLNKKELRDYSLAELKGFFSAVYQDFSKHEFTLKENILIGNLSLKSSDEDNKLINNALIITEMDKFVENLPDKIDTNLGKIHDNGVDISDGQWQRLAMARAIVSSAPVRILDEPTASLDPVSENKIYELFSKISHSALTIFISHRLASTKIADEILVFENGTITEKGSFEDLLAQKGLYWKMFEEQRSWYL